MDHTAGEEEVCLGFFLKGLTLPPDISIIMVKVGFPVPSDMLWPIAGGVCLGEAFPLERDCACDARQEKKPQELKMKRQLGFGLRKISRLSDTGVTPYSLSFPGRCWVKCSNSKLVK